MGVAPPYVSKFVKHGGACGYFGNEILAALKCGLQNLRTASKYSGSNLFLSIKSFLFSNTPEAYRVFLDLR